MLEEEAKHTSEKCSLWLDFPYLLQSLKKEYIQSWELLIQSWELLAKEIKEFTLGRPKWVEEDRSGLKASWRSRLKNKPNENFHYGFLKLTIHEYKTIAFVLLVCMHVCCMCVHVCVWERERERETRIRISQSFRSG